MDESKQSIDKTITTEPSVEHDLFETFVRNHLGIVYHRHPDSLQFSFVGGAVDEITGYPLERVQSGDVTWESLVYPDDRSRRSQRIDEGIAAELANIEVEYRILTSEGTVRWVNERIRTAVDSDSRVMLEGAIQDVSRRILIEQALRSSEAFSSAVIEHSPLAIAVHSMTGRLLMVNDAWRQVWRVDDDSLQWLMARRQQTEALEVIYGHLSEWMKEINAVFEDGGSLYVPEACMTFDGGRQERWVTHHLYAIRDHLGTVQRVVVITTEITERRNAEKAIRDATEQLRSERRALEEKNAALKQVLDHLEQEKNEYKNELCGNVEHALMPYVRKLKQDHGRLSDRDLAHLESAVRSIVGKDLDEFKTNFARLSPREAQICDLIRDGLTSKEISDDLNVSLLTVHKHREQIRKKLKLDNRNINLSTYLRSH